MSDLPVESAPGAEKAGPRPAIVAVVDVVLVLVFAALGRAAHAEANPVLGVLATAWPFLVGLGMGWTLVRRRSGMWPSAVGPGVTVWLMTLVIGMFLRLVTGSGTAPAFVLVAGAVLAVFLLGSRWVWSRRGGGR